MRPLRLASLSPGAALTALLPLLALTSPLAQAASLFASKPHPLVIFHGLGDSAYAEGMQSFAQSLKDAFPGLFVHLVALEDNLDADREASFFGLVNDQIEQVCEQLAGVEDLQDGADAIGFSQGGQFLRAYIQRCNKPAIRNLVTFGSQHMGIAELPTCKSGDFFCKLAEAALRSGVNTEYAQSHVVPAQYFRNSRDAASYKAYLARNHFLTDINNELSINETYRKNLQTLDNFVMLQFDEDVTVVPRASSWFSSYAVANKTKAEGKEPVPDEPVPLRQSPIYLEDRLGLRAMDARGALTFDACKGPHMHIDAACQMKVFGKWVGTPASVLPRPVRHAWASLVWNLFGLQISPQPAVVQLMFALWLTATASFIIRLVLNVSGLSRRWSKESDGRIALP